MTSGVQQERVAWVGLAPPPSNSDIISISFKGPNIVYPSSLSYSGVVGKREIEPLYNPTNYIPLTKPETSSCILLFPTNAQQRIYLPLSFVVTTSGKAGVPT